jgi:hypothetical protein
VFLSYIIIGCDRLWMKLLCASLVLQNFASDCDWFVCSIFLLYLRFVRWKWRMLSEHIRAVTWCEICLHSPRVVRVVGSLCHIYVGINCLKCVWSCIVYQWLYSSHFQEIGLQSSGREFYLFILYLFLFIFWILRLVAVIRIAVLVRGNHLVNEVVWPIFKTKIP